MFISKRRLGLSVLTIGGALGFALASLPQADAATISWNAQAYTKSARIDSNTYLVQGGIPAGSILPPPYVDAEALQAFYQTSGAPYFLQSITYHDTGLGGATFGPPGQTLKSGALGNGSSDPVNPLTPVAGGIQQTFVETTPGNPEFAQGPNSSEFSYIQINGPSGELAGADPNSLGSLGFTLFGNGNSLILFNGAQVDLVFQRLSTADPALYPAFQLTQSANFGVQSTPNTDPVTLNFAQVGGNITVPTGVPEPGMVALFLGMGISGSGLLLRRRRR